MKVTFSERLHASILFVFMVLAAGPSSGLCDRVGEGVIPLNELVMGGRVEKPQPPEDLPKVMKPEVLIQLSHTQFDPLFKLPAAQVGIPAIKAYDADQTGYFIVQFGGPIQSDWKSALTAAGVEIFDYLPEYSFIVRMRASAMAAVKAMHSVRWVGIYQPSYRVSHGALDTLYSVKSGEQGARAVLRVNLFPGVDPVVVESAINALGGAVTDKSGTTLKTSLLVTIPAGRIGGLAAIEGVKWIEPVPRWKLSNAVATDIMGIHPRKDHGLYGQGQTVAVADTGLDQGYAVAASLHTDFQDGSGGSRVLQVIDRVAADEKGVNDASDINGHGTHVAGSVLGNGVLSGSTPGRNDFPATCQAGAAPKANLIFQAIENNDNNALDGIPNDLNDLFLEADNAGAHIHTNSWGAASGSQYDSYAADVDEYMWSHQDFLILFAAGNEGADLDADGVVDPYSIGSPASAKNCLSVGASENDRSSGAGINAPWGSENWAAFYPAEPIRSDHVSNNENGMAAFSSRGPTLDGRYKPDLVAPGTNILSARTSAIDSSQWIGWGNYSKDYVWFGGTSMATPLAAGAAALMREYLTTHAGIATPSAALIKAALINSATDMTPGQYGTGKTREIPDSPVPNSVEGWGRVNIANGVFPVAPRGIVYHDETTGLNTGESKEYRVTVTDAREPLKVSLVWTDYPGAPAAQGGLVNDLDLKVTAPSSRVHYPDRALQKAPVSTLAYDDDLYVGMKADSCAVRFTPASHPAYLDSVTFVYANFGESEGVAVVVYGDNAGAPDTGNVLFEKRLSYAPSGSVIGAVTIPMALTIRAGDFHVAIIKGASTMHGIVTDSSPFNGRTSASSDSGRRWSEAKYNAIIKAVVRYKADASTSFDRVNNTVGLTIDAPEVGDYLINVSGHNVPKGPQPFALVASGDVRGVVFPSARFSAAAYTVNEGGATVTVMVERVGDSAGAASIDYLTQNGTAVAGADYTAAKGTLTWADGESDPKSFTITINDDSESESNETVNLALENPTGNLILGSPSSAVLTIVDNEACSIRFSNAAYSVVEIGGSATISVTRSNTNGAVSINYATSDGSATAGADYTATSGVLHMADGQGGNSFSIPITNDGKDEPDETVQITLSNPAPAGSALLGDPHTAVLTIINDNTLTAVKFMNASFNIGEGVEFARIQVVRTPANGAISVNYATSDGTAVAGSDYEGVSGVLEFPHGVISQEFLVPIINDTLKEDVYETIILTLSNPVSAGLGDPSTAVLSITDNDNKNHQDGDGRGSSGGCFISTVLVE